jgi:hypothetical protein
VEFIARLGKRGMRVVTGEHRYLGPWDVLIHEMYELGIDPVFWKKEAVQ